VSKEDPGTPINPPNPKRKKPNVPEEKKGKFKEDEKAYSEIFAAPEQESQEDEERSDSRLSIYDRMQTRRETQIIDLINYGTTKQQQDFMKQWYDSYLKQELKG